ncbi:hypothetical protein AAF712_016282 [Marasmius tenuissimus]|uniref:Zinc finger protein n=1 Tax=Marasmius tenuissimus TaxID=585030 RepID=A0ABR2Z761_9AGAR
MADDLSVVQGQVDENEEGISVVRDGGAVVDPNAPCGTSPQMPTVELRVLQPRTVIIEDVPESEDEDEREQDRVLDEEHGVDWSQEMDEDNYMEAGLDGLS